MSPHFYFIPIIAVSHVSVLMRRKLGCRFTPSLASLDRSEPEGIHRFVCFLSSHPMRLLGTVDCVVHGSPEFLCAVRRILLNGRSIEVFRVPGTRNRTGKLIRGSHAAPPLFFQRRHAARLSRLIRGLCSGCSLGHPHPHEDKGGSMQA